MFAFGRNWRKFVEQHLDSQAIQHATESLLDLLAPRVLRGQSFVDVGCGSGLSSLVAYRLGASRVFSFDLDADSVACCRYLRELEGAPDNWHIEQGSALDERFLQDHGTFDVVYSWGVLHHTGSMWQAIDNTAKLVGREGVLVLAIYNRAEAFGLYPDGRFGPSKLWRPLKRLYCRLPRLLQGILDAMTLSVFFGACLVTLQNPMRSLRQYRQSRGMSLRVDIRDWLGGYPYEYAAVDEVFRFLSSRGFQLRNLKYHGGLRCNEYVFSRRSRAEGDTRAAEAEPPLQVPGPREPISRT